MTAIKLKKSELANLHSKLVLYNLTKNPTTGQGDPRLLSDVNRYAFLVMRRKRVDLTKYQIDPANGIIKERKKE